MVVRIVDPQGTTDRSPRCRTRTLPGRERKGRVLGAGEPQERHRRSGEVSARIPELKPPVALSVALASADEPGFGEIEKSAPVDGNCKPETFLKPGGVAADHRSPGDAGETDVSCVNLRKRREQRAGEECRSDRMKHPLFRGRLLRVGQIAPARRSRVRMARPLRATVGIFIPGGDAAAGVHAYGGESVRIPEPDPVGKGGRSAAVDEHHARNRMFRRGVFRPSIPGEDPGGASPAAGAVVEKRFNPFGFKAGGGMALRKSVKKRCAFC